MDFGNLPGVDQVVLAAACAKLTDTWIRAGVLDTGMQPSCIRLCCMSAALLTPLAKQSMQPTG